MVTEILAKQHYNLAEIISKRILSALIVGTSSYKDKKKILKNFQK